MPAVNRLFDYHTAAARIARPLSHQHLCNQPSCLPTPPPLCSAHPGVAKVAFTGSVATGRRVYAAAAGNLRPATMELGGKSGKF